MNKKPKLVITCALETEPFAIDHIGIKQGLEKMQDKIDYEIIDPIAREDDQLAKDIVKAKPDIVIYYMDRCLAGKVPEKVARQHSCQQVFWELDYRPKAHNVENSYGGQWPVLLSQAAYLNHIFISNKGQIDWWKKDWDLPVTYLPHGTYVPDKLEKDEKHYYPAVFIGAMLDAPWLRRRRDFILKVKQLLPELHLLNERDRAARNLVWKNMPEIYHTSDVVLDMSHEWENPGYCSGRYFYTAALGGCCISKRFPDCEDLYPEGIKHYFDTPEEAVKLMKYYMEYEKEREKSKIRAWEHSKQHHSCVKRFETIFKKLNVKL